MHENHNPLLVPAIMIGVVISSNLNFASSVRALVIPSFRESLSVLSILACGWSLAGPSALRDVVPFCHISTSCSSSSSFTFSRSASFVLFHLDPLSSVLTCTSFGGLFCHLLLTISCVRICQRCVPSEDRTLLLAIGGGLRLLVGAATPLRSSH